MKFRNKKTGSILEPNSKFVEEQMIKYDLYEEIIISKKTEKKADTKSDKE